MRRLWLVLLAAAACGPPSHLLLSSGQAQVAIDLKPFRLRVLDASGAQLLSSTTQGGSDGYGTPSATIDVPTFQGQLLPGWDGYRDGTPTWSHAANATLVKHSATSATVRLDTGSAQVTLEVSVEGERVHYAQTALLPDGTTPSHLWGSTVSFDLPADEHFFGMGERYATVDHRGWSLYNWAEEAGLGGGEGTPPDAGNPYPNGPSMTYFPVPFFLSSKGYGLRMESTYRSVMHFGSERPDAWRMFVSHPSFAMTLYVSADPLQVINDLTQDTGRPRTPVPWAFGVHRRIDVNATVNGVPEWQLMRQQSVPITGIDDSTHFLPASDQVGREQVLSTWVSTLHANGFKVFAYNNPYVSASFAGGAADFAFGSANGFFVKGPDGKPSLTTFSSAGLQQVAAVDFTSAAASAWYQGLLRRTLAVGYDGWMHDFGEYTARDAVFSDGRQGEEMHNLYPVLSAQVAADLLSREKPDSVFFVRSGAPGTQMFAPMSWGGDPEADFDDTQGLPSALRAGLNLSMSGMPYWGSDVSGYKCLIAVPHDKEVFLRWTELAAVSPWWKEENACFNPLQAQTKWTLWSDAETTATYARYGSLHTRLQPYFLALAQQAALTGVPLTRHPVLLYPQEPGAWATDDSFFLGPALFTSPVVRRGQTSKQVWLPPGRYIDWFDGTLYQGGGTVTLPASLDQLPLLLVESQLVPLLDASVQSLAPATDPSVPTAQSLSDRLDVVVALPVGGHAELVLADGTRLTASRGTSGIGNPHGLAQVTGAGIADCASCFALSNFGALSRLQANTALATDADLALDELTLSSHGGPTRRVRWDVRRVP